MDQIETYNLFGEDADLPDVVHCETIAERSLLHNWEFRPHRHARLHQFLLVDAGGGAAQIEGMTHRLSPGTLVNMPMRVVHGFRFEEGTEGWVVTVASELLAEALHEGEGLRPMLNRPHVLTVGREATTIVQAIFAEHPSRDFARAHILRSLSALLAGLVARAIAAQQPERPRTGHRLHQRFEALVDQHFAEHLRVAEYADKLAVTSTHLSRVMRQVTGRPASATIEDRVVREARRHLAYSNLPVAEVAYQLGFQDPAYFSRFFTRATGMAPRAFRAQIEHSAPMG